MTDELGAHIERLDRDGCTIVHDAFDADLADELHADIEIGRAHV